MLSVIITSLKTFVVFEFILQPPSNKFEKKGVFQFLDIIFSFFASKTLKSIRLELGTVGLFHAVKLLSEAVVFLNIHRRRSIGCLNLSRQLLSLSLLGPFSPTRYIKYRLLSRNCLYSQHAMIAFRVERGYHGDVIQNAPCIN